jgi:hypothetical protein
LEDFADEKKGSYTEVGRSRVHIQSIEKFCIVLGITPCLAAYFLSLLRSCPIWVAFFCDTPPIDQQKSNTLHMMKYFVRSKQPCMLEPRPKKSCDARTLNARSNPREGES